MFLFWYFYCSRLLREHGVVFFSRFCFGNCFDGDRWMSASSGEMKVYLICVLYHFVWVIFHILKLVCELYRCSCFNYNIKNYVILSL